MQIRRMLPSNLRQCAVCEKPFRFIQPAIRQHLDANAYDISSVSGYQVILSVRCDCWTFAGMADIDREHYTMTKAECVRWVRRFVTAYHRRPSVSKTS